MNVTHLRGRRATDRSNRVSMGDMFERIRWHDPDRVVMTFWEGAYESADLKELTAQLADDTANQYAQAILSTGIEPGSIVMLVCENSAEAILTKIGLAKAGVTVAPVNPNLGSDVIEELIKLCEPRGVVVDSENLEKIEPLLQRHGIPVLHQIAVGTTAPGHRSFAQFIAGHPSSEPDVEIHGDDIWQLLFTSGSTSTPKGVMVSHINTMFSALSFNGIGMNGVAYESDFCMISFLPIVYHVGDGVVYNAVLSGGRAVIGRRFNPQAVAQAIHRDAVTCLWAGAPQALDAICTEFEAHPELSPQSLRTIIFGWAPMSPELHARSKRVLGEQTKCIEIIGQTEVVCAHRFWIDKHQDLFDRTAPRENYVGQPHELLAAMIADKDGNPIPAGSDVVGEAAYRSPALMAGYYKKPKETAEALRNNWFFGGDAFKWGESGQRILADRFKDIVKTGGENVTSIRVEAAINLFPGVHKTAIVGLPHERWGEAVTAFVVAKPGFKLSEPELIAFAKNHLANFEIPKKVVVVDQLPETVGGKVQKHKLRAQYHDLYQG
nr:acyl--CoA ligase [Pseudomonas sp.]